MLQILFLSSFSLQLREAMAALRKSAQDVQKFMDAVNKKSSSQDLHKGRGREVSGTDGRWLPVEIS